MTTELSMNKLMNGLGDMSSDRWKDGQIDSRTDRHMTHRDCMHSNIFIVILSLPIVNWQKLPKM